MRWPVTGRKGGILGQANLVKLLAVGLRETRELENSRETFGRLPSTVHQANVGFYPMEKIQLIA